MSEVAHKSKYAAKKESGRQMYGPGCCAHSVTASQVAAARAKAKLSDPHLTRNALVPQLMTWSDSP